MGEASRTCGPSPGQSRRRRGALLLGSGLAGLAATVAAAGPAWALNDCGPTTGATVTCTSAGNPYASGITYAPAASLTLDTNADVVSQGTINLNSATAAALAVNNAGTVATLVNDLPGISSRATAGAVSIANTGSITTTGNGADGIDGYASGAVAITTGAVKVTGTGSAGASGISTAGAVSATINGAVVSSAADGVDIKSATTSTVTVAMGGSISGAVNGLSVNAAGGETITNNGAITGPTAAGSTGYAVSSIGTATLNNTGVITGRLNLSGQGIVVNNSGTIAITGIDDVGEGSDTFNNSGVVSVVSTGVLPAGNVGLIGLNNFNNTGLIDLRNGRAGDVFQLPGNFNAKVGSQAALDVQLGASGSLADKLVLGTVTGATTLVIHDVGTGPGALNTGITIVTATGGATAGSFTLANGPIEKGFIRYNLVFNSASDSYALVGTPGAPAYQTLKFTEGAENLWRASADAWSTHMSELRDAQWLGESGALRPGFHAWAQVFGSDTRRGENETYTVFGQTQGVSLSYHQNYIGFEAGADVVGHMGGLDLVGGVDAGYTHSKLRFGGSADGADYDTPNVGLYGAVLAGPAFVNLLVKYDHDDISASSNAASYSRNFGGDDYGVDAEAGYRLGGPGFYVEPVASIAYVRASLDSFSAQGADFDLHSGDSALGKVGARVGGAYRLADGLTLSPYAGAHAVQEFDGRNAVDFTSGGDTVHFTDRRPDTYGQGELGVDFSGWRRLSGFVQLDGDFAGRESGLGGRLGVRVPL